VAVHTAYTMHEMKKRDGGKANQHGYSARRTTRSNYNVSNRSQAKRRLPKADTSRDKPSTTQVSPSWGQDHIAGGINPPQHGGRAILRNGVRAEAPVTAYKPDRHSDALPRYIQ
jgi:hypothetical protein